MSIRLPLDAITFHPQTQARVELNLDTVAEYAAVFASGGHLPDPVVFFDGSNYWLGDGYHTVNGARRAGLTHLVVDLRQGTLRDAILYAVGANASHGLRRSPADKRKAIGLLLADPEWSAWSDKEIARACRVGSDLVRECRAAQASLAATASETGPAHLPETASENLPQAVAEKVKAIKEAGGTPRVTTTKHGTVTAMDVSKIGKKQRAAEPEPEADPDLGEDPATLLAETQADVERLTAQVKALTADDTKAEVLKLHQLAAHAQREQSFAMERAAKAVEREKWAVRQLQRCGKAVGEADPDKIAAKVEALAREVAALKPGKRVAA